MTPIKKTSVEEAYEYAKNDYNNALSYSNHAAKNFIDALRGLRSAHSRRTVYRLMNDIRTGKIIPVIAETGEIANVTFS